MKASIILLSLFIFISCTQQLASPDEISFGESVVINHSKSISIENKLRVSYDSFQESRCPKNVTCARQGELFATVLIENTSTQVTSIVVFCVSGECLPKNNSSGSNSYYFSGDTFKVGDETYKLYIEEFTPLEASQSSIPTDYSLKIKVTK